MLVVDSQVHIWGENTQARPWDATRPAKPHRPGGFGAAELGVAMAEAGVDRALLVPPSWEGDRNDLALAAARANPDRFAVAGRLPDGDGEEALATWLEAGMRAMRLTLRTERELRFLTDPAQDWLWAGLERAGIPMMVYPNDRTQALQPILARHSGLRLTVDHMGLRRAKDTPALAGLPDLLALARFPSVSVKASCLPFFTTDPYPFRSLHEPLRQVIDAFGPQRVFWGSDMTRLPCSYRQCVTMFTEELPWLSADALSLVMGRALCSWLSWD